tara:strand:+ start:85 stop:462 length:378 start_codon:yes stop_codon:yes gene_type:complete
MRIALDIDDTITRCPEFFSFISKALIDAGHKVIIITFRYDRLETKRFLVELGIQYTTLVTSNLHTDYYDDVNTWKGEVCSRYKVDIFFEDMPAVLQHVDPSTLCFMPIEKNRTDMKTLAGEEETF